MKKIIIILFLIISTQTYSQSLSSKNKKAIEYFNKALTFYNAYKYDKAIYWSEAALKKDDEFIEVYYLLSDIYDELKQPVRKILMLKKAIVINPQKSTLAYYTLIKTELSIGKYKDAKRFKTLSFHDAIRMEEINVMDTAALAMSKDNDMPLMVFELFKGDNLIKAVKGEDIGIFVSNNVKTEITEE